ncbi:MAG: Gfo/Idh/MocA family protein, partial [Candidatus Hermodarchaeota archaeon]
SIKIRGVADVDENKLDILRTNNPYNIEYFTSDPNEIIKDKRIDIIYITSPTKFHKDFYIRAAEEGKNIFCEKPIAFYLEDIREMISIEKKHGILTHVGLVLRHCPVFWKIKQILLNNHSNFGKRLSFIFRDTQEWPIGSHTHPSEWRKDPSLAHAGCLFEHGIHDVDLIEYFFPDDFKLSNLYAKIRYVSPITQKSLDDVATLKFEYEDGFVGNLISIWNKTRLDERHLEVFFENGYLVLDGYNIYSFKKCEYIIGNRKKSLKFNDIVDEYQKAHSCPKINPQTGPYLYENLQFLKSILKEETPHPGLEIGYRAHEIVDYAYHSSRENKIIYF